MDVECSAYKRSGPISVGRFVMKKRGDSHGILHKFEPFSGAQLGRYLPVSACRTKEIDLKIFVYFWWTKQIHFRPNRKAPSHTCTFCVFRSHPLHIYWVAIYLGNWVLVNGQEAKEFVVKYKCSSVGTGNLRRFVRFQIERFEESQISGIFDSLARIGQIFQKTKKILDIYISRLFHQLNT